MSRSSKSSSSKTSKKKHSAVPPKGATIEASAPQIAVPSKAPAAPVNKTVHVEVTQPAAKHVEAAKASSAPVTQPVAAAPAAKEVAKGPTPAVAALITELESASPQRRLAAASEIAKSGDRHAVPALIAALNDSDADVAREAATALGILSDRSEANATVFDALIEVLSDTNGYYHSVVRAAAAQSLGQLKDARAFDALLSAVTDPIAEASVEAVRALTALNDRQAVSVFIDVVRNRSGFFVATVRRAAVAGLAHFGGADAMAQLRFVASDEWEDGVIRDEAQAAIERHSA